MQNATFSPLTNPNVLRLEKMGCVFMELFAIAVANALYSQQAEERKHQGKHTFHELCHLTLYYSSVKKKTRKNQSKNNIF